MIKKRIIAILISIGLCGLFGVYVMPKYIGTNTTYFAVVPHFSIAEKKINHHYQLIKKTYNLDSDNLNILIISPDHYKAGNNTITLNEINKNLCYKAECIDIKGIYVGKNEQINDKYIQEHGWGEHFFYIKKYFPKSNIYLAKLEPRNFFDTKSILSKFKKLEKEGDLLVLSSVDFSHYVEEDRANLHDITSKYTMNNSIEENDYKKMEVDCPLCLYITNLWAVDRGLYPNFISRDSSSTLHNTDLGFDNTSRQRFLYTGNKQTENGITLAFFGDLIFDRGVKHTLKEYSDIANHFSGRYQLGNTSNIPKNNIHRKGFGIDFLGFNLETPYNNKETSTYSKRFGSLSFYSSGEVLGVLSNLGFNLVNIANNHTLDLGLSGYRDTKEELTKNKIDYFGYIQTKLTTENTILEKNIRGINIAFHGYNFYNRFSGDIESYCEILNTYKKSDFINIVNVHRGNEYEGSHNSFQEKIGKKLIDCGADGIIGHHPHVIQEIERYQGKPIIYSLGNFLFDQYTDETNKGLYVLMDIKSGGKIQLWTGIIASTP